MGRLSPCERSTRESAAGEGPTCNPFCECSLTSARPDARPPPHIAGDKWLGSRNGEALRVVHADATQAREDWGALHELGNRLLAHHVPDAVDGFDHRAIDRVDQHVRDETAVDFEKIHRQVLEITERGHSRAE